jgi:hypothetical protein
MAVAASLEIPRFLLSGKAATAVICQTMAENESSRNHMSGIHMNTPAGKGLRGGRCVCVSGKCVGKEGGSVLF